MKVNLSMTQNTLLNMLKISITIGLCLIALGIYLHFFSEKMYQLGATGIIISATCIAIGLIFSLPTKIFLTMLLMKLEADKKIAATSYNKTKSHYKGSLESGFKSNIKGASKSSLHKNQQKKDNTTHHKV